MILATLTIAFEAKLISLFLTMQQLHIDNTLPSIFLPWITDAFIIFLLRQHFAELPQDLFDAAIIDGCSYFRMYWNVMLPNIVPALVSAAFIKFIFSWDSFIWPSIVITDESKTVITVALAKLFSDDIHPLGIGLCRFFRGDGACSNYFHFLAALLCARIRAFGHQMTWRNSPMRESLDSL